MKRNYSCPVAAIVLGILFVPQVVEQLPLHASGLRAPLQVGAVLLAAYIVVGYWLLSGLRLRVHLAALVCFLVFGLSLVPYLFVSLRDIHEAYLGCLLQYTAYPMVVAVFLPSVLSPRRIIRLCCIFLAVQGLPTCFFVLLNIARGRLPMIQPVSFNPVTDANSLVLGSLAFITLAAMQPREERRGRPQRLKRSAWITAAVVLALVAASTFSRATLGGFLAALLLLLVLRFRGRRSAVRTTRAIIFACAALPLLVCTHVISSEVVERVGSVIIKKRANEEILGSSLVRRAELWRVFVTRLSPFDVVGTRPALHEYAYYHGLGVRQTIETPHNYWISMLLTAGYGGTLEVLMI